MCGITEFYVPGYLGSFSQQWLTSRESTSWMIITDDAGREDLCEPPSWGFLWAKLCVCVCSQGKSKHYTKSRGLGESGVSRRLCLPNCSSPAVIPLGDHVGSLESHQHPAVNGVSGSICTAVVSKEVQWGSGTSPPARMNEVPHHHWCEQRPFGKQQGCTPTPATQGGTGEA